MTVAELITQLQSLPGDATVLVLDENQNFCHLGYCTEYPEKDAKIFYDTEDFDFPVVALLPVSA